MKPSLSVSNFINRFKNLTSLHNSKIQNSYPLTLLLYIYIFLQTQPVPNPMSYYMHQEPEFMHKFETLSNHFIELVAPFFLIYPRRLVMIGGGIQILFQVCIDLNGRNT